MIGSVALGSSPAKAKRRDEERGHGEGGGSTLRAERAHSACNGEAQRGDDQTKEPWLVVVVD